MEILAVPFGLTFVSPLLWDVFAISTYFTVSLLFWYSGLFLILRPLRDRAKTKLRKWLYGFASFGWAGSAKHWQRHEMLSLVLAGLSTPLVLSVHTIVSYDFRHLYHTGLAYHHLSTLLRSRCGIFWFCYGTNLIGIDSQSCLNLQEYITIGHIEAMNKVIVLTGSIVGVAYLTELFIAFYSGVLWEAEAFRLRVLGPYWWAYWAMMTCNVVSPQLFWFKKLRRNVWFTFFMSIIVNIGMWFERFVIIMTLTQRLFTVVAGRTTHLHGQKLDSSLAPLVCSLPVTSCLPSIVPVIAIAEIKFILKTSGQNFKDKMNTIEEKTDEHFMAEQLSHH
jgi:hypothetical protein